MEDLWKVKELRFRLGDVADQAEYDLLLKRFRAEEQQANLKNLLFEQNPFPQETDVSKK